MEIVPASLRVDYLTRRLTRVARPFHAGEPKPATR